MESHAALTKPMDKKARLIYSDAYKRLSCGCYQNAKLNHLRCANAISMQSKAIMKVSGAGCAVLAG